MIRHATFLMLLLGSVASADEPAALYIFPAGGQRGATVDVRIGGMSLHDSCPLHVKGAGVVASPTIRRTERLWFEGPVIPLPDSQRNENYPSDYAGQFKLAADAPVGTCFWRVSTSQGVTCAMRFIVGVLPEVVEEEIDGEPIPFEVKLPVTVNGRMFPREDIDLWSFEARQGETIRCEVVASRIGSPLDSQLEVLDSAGRRVAVNGDTFGADSLIVFTAPADGRYQVKIHDAAFGGLQTYVYRLTISSEPHVLSFYPLGGRRGGKTQFELRGVNVPAETQQVALPADAPTTWSQDFAVGGKRSNLVMMETGDVQELLEAEPNEDAAKLKPIAAPCVCNGRINRGGDFDRWAVVLKKGESLDFDLRAGRLGSPLDSVLVIEDAAGKELARNDDIGGAESDSQLRFTAPQDGTFVARVEERYKQRGGSDYAYRLHVGSPAPPDFRLTMSLEALTLYRDGQAKLRVQAQRTGGFNDPIALTVDGLPPGVTLTGDKVNKGQAQVDLTFKADGSAKIQLHELAIRGVATIDGKEITRLATFATERGEPTIDRLSLAVSMPTPFKVVSVFSLPYAPRGTVYYRHYSLERGGYEGPLEVRMAEKQVRHLQGVSGSVISVPPAATEFNYPAVLPPWLELGRTSRSVVTAIGTVVDGDGRKHLVSFTSPHQNEQISLIASPCPLGVELDPANVALSSKQPVEVDVRIDRDTSIAGPVRVELIVPRHIQGVSAAPIVVPAQANTGRLQLVAETNAGPFNMPLTIRATLGEGDRQVVNETKLEVVRAAP